MSSPTDTLRLFLARASLHAEVDPNRLAPPSQYDALYNFAVLGCALMTLGKRDPEGGIRINSTVLKFAYFLAIRPGLLDRFREWRNRQSQGPDLELEAWPFLPRGFLSDDTPSSAVTYLVALGSLSREGRDVVLRGVDELHPVVALVRKVEDENWFASERVVIRALLESRVTQTLLGVA